MGMITKESALAHFTQLLASTPAEKKRLRTVFEQWASSTSSANTVTVEFEGQVRLVAEGADPKHKAPGGLPRELAKILKAYRELRVLRRNDLLVSLRAEELDPAEGWLDETPLAKHTGLVWLPLRLGPDVCIYHPKTKRLLRLDHEEVTLDKPVKTSLGGVLIEQLANALNVGSAATGARGKVPKGVLREGNLEGLKVDSLERFLSQYTDEQLASVTYLRCSSGSLSTTRGIERLVNLRGAKLSENRLTKLEGLSGLISLESLDLDSNRLTTLEPLAALPLRTLRVIQNELTTLRGLEKMATLTTLDLRDNPITGLGPLKQFAKLEQLNAAGTALKRIEGLEHLTSVSRLSLFGHGTPTIEAKSLEFLIERNLMGHEREWLLSLPVEGTLPKKYDALLEPDRLLAQVREHANDAKKLAPLLEKARTLRLTKETLEAIGEASLNAKLTPALLDVWVGWLKDKATGRGVSNVLNRFTSLAFGSALETKNRAMLERLVGHPSLIGTRRASEVVRAQAVLGDEAALVAAIHTAIERGVDAKSLGREVELKAHRTKPAVKAALATKPGPRVEIMKAVRQNRRDAWLEEKVGALPQPLALSAAESEVWVDYALELAELNALGSLARVARMLPMLVLEPSARMTMLQLLFTVGALPQTHPLAASLASRDFSAKGVTDGRVALAMARMAMSAHDVKKTLEWATCAVRNGIEPTELSAHDDFGELIEKEPKLEALFKRPS